MLFKTRGYVEYNVLVKRVADIEWVRFIDQTARHNLRVINRRESR